jgi:hypothetical protein
MQRSTAVTVALLVACVAAVPVVGIAASGSQPTQVTDNSSNSTNSSVTPGERLSGVVGVQGAELEGEIDERAFGIQVAQAATNESRAAVVAGKLAELEQRVEELDERTQRLGEARANGSISEGEYRAELGEVAARSQSTQRLVNASNETASGLPADVLEANGVNVSAIQTLKKSAGNLTGPEVAAVARSIAGPSPGIPPSVDTGPADRGPGDRGNRTDTADGAETPEGNSTDTPERDGTGTPEDSRADTQRGDETETQTRTDRAGY